MTIVETETPPPADNDFDLYRRALWSVGKQYDGEACRVCAFERECETKHYHVKPDGAVRWINAYGCEFRLIPAWRKRALKNAN